MNILRWFTRTPRKQEQTIAPQPLTSEVFTVDKRVYLSDAAYALPKDWKEDQRLDMQHFMLRKYLRGNFLAPIKNPRTILDVACGTGRWGAEMARQFPNANVFGVDIRPPEANNTAILGSEGIKPENYTVLQGDITKGVLNQWQNLFEFTHMRLMVAGLPEQQWDGAVRSLVEMTTPGGWVELIDIVNYIAPKDSLALQKIYAWSSQALASRKFDMMAGEHLAERMTRSGLINIHFYKIDIPIGYAVGEDGGLMAANLEAAMGSLKPLCVQTGVVSDEEYSAALLQYHQDLETARGESFPFYAAYGQKPLR